MPIQKAFFKFFLIRKIIANFQKFTKFSAFFQLRTPSKKNLRKNLKKAFCIGIVYVFMNTMVYNTWL